VGRILGKGYSPADYTLLCYGGGGPLHVAGYTAGVPYQQVLVPEWAAGFSAFGCACAEFEYRFDRQVDLPLLPMQSAEEQVQMGALLTQTWRQLEERVRAEFEKSGYRAEDVSFTHMVRMQYYGQLVDIELDAPKPAIETAEDLEALKAAFEVSYTRTYARAASSPELGYLVSKAIVRGSVDIEKPTLPHMDRVGGSPPVKASRDVWWRDGFAATDVYEMDDVQRGHVIEGPAVLEAESTTFPIPPDRRVELDEHGIFHLENRGA
jgi:N-methylhydantoinase A/oxoprolinase/acetone carboxylase beta subunit